MRDLKPASSVDFCLISARTSGKWLGNLKSSKNDKNRFLETLWSLFWHEKKWIFFPTFCICRPNPCAYRPDFFHFREIWKISIRAQISKWTRFLRFCRNLPILKYDGAEIRRFRKILKNRDFRHFGPQICCRSHYRPSEFPQHFRDLQHIQRPNRPKSHFSKKFRKLRHWRASYFKMSKFRQNLADVVHFEIWATIRDFREINYSRSGYAENSTTHEKFEKNRKFLHLGPLNPSLYLRSSYATPMNLGSKICPENASKLALSSVLKWASLMCCFNNAHLKCFCL